MSENKGQFGSELERTNLEVHVDMDRQRYKFLSDKVNSFDERIDDLTSELSNFRTEHAKNMAELKQSQIQAIATLREEQAQDTQGTIKVVVGAAATIIAGLISGLVAIIIAFL